MPSSARKRAKKKEKMKTLKMNSQHAAAAATTTGAAILDDESESKRAEKKEKKPFQKGKEVQTPSPTEAAEKKNLGKRMERSSEGLENVPDPAHMQTPPAEPEVYSAKKQRTQSPKIDGLNLEDLGRPVPFELTVYRGEDVASKVLRVWEASDHSSCIISAFGHISKAEFRRPNSDTFHIYEGDFEILSMSGNYVNQEDGSTVWCLSITLAGSDRKAFGGTLINTLIASTPVTLLMMNFVKDWDEAGTSAADAAADDETNAKALSDSAEKKKKKKKKNKNKTRRLSASTSGGADVPCVVCMENTEDYRLLDSFGSGGQ